LVDQAEATHRLTRALVGATVAILVLTCVLVVLTVVLVAR
jgi:hypothetical protein